MVLDLIRSKLAGDSGGRGMLGTGADAELASQCEVVAESFDAAFYAARNPEIRRDHLQHFMTLGWRDGRDPAPWFSTGFYLKTYPDVADAGLNPFYHYIHHGREEGRLIAPAEQPKHDRSWEIEAIRKEIDEPFYADQLRRIKINSTGLDMALHYWCEGAGLGLDPTADFSTTHYLTTHADVAAAGVNPFAHYLEQGRKEGRMVQPIELPVVAPQDVADPQDGERSLVEGAFDVEFYLAAYPDVAVAGVDPLKHFLNNGWQEGRNPNLWFSVSDYLEFYPDVASAGINPFLHYLMAGKSEGRIPRHELGFRYDIIRSLQPLEQRIEQARTWASRRKVSSGKSLGEALRKATRLETKGLYLTVSHDDFIENFGGVQLVLMRESAAVEQMGFDHLHLFPASAIPVADLDPGDRDPVLGVLLNRKRLGFYRASEIEREFRVVSPRLRSQPFVIHSLIRHKVSALVGILKALRCRSGWYWVHDYSSICTGYTLLRNDVEFCSGPPPASTACSLCIYGGLRVEQIKAHERLFEEFELTVLAPSEAALDVWKGSSSIVAPARVHEHLKFVLPKATARKARKVRPSPARPLRVAYVGQAVSHKGWLAFRDLALRFGKDSRYEFYHVGKDPNPGVPVIYKEVAVGPDDLDKMTRTLGELEIDVAIMWSLWPETFCIAAAEALVAGAAILTFKDSGNVAAMVTETGFGAVLDSEAELERIFDTGEVRKLAGSARPMGLSVKFSNMTADFLKGKAA